MAKPSTLLVHPNPFHALDHFGHPNCAMPKEPEGHVGNPIDNREFIGAQLRHSFESPAYDDGDARQRAQRTWFAFDDEPVRVPHTAYYRHALMRREILVADKETADAVGLRFVDPGAALEAERDAACGLWARQAHEDHDDVPPEALTAFAFGPMPEAIARRKAAMKAVAGDAKSAADAAKKPTTPASSTTAVKLGGE